MKLLIVTQNVDRTDPILGFFHRWIEQFSRRCEHVTVIGQSIADDRFPSTVSVRSLGKERGLSKLAQIITFWRLIVRERAAYDAVFVHMTPVWIVLGAPLWFLLRKHMYLWYEVKRGSTFLSIALRCVRVVFCATVQGIPVPTKHQRVVGHGIDTLQFTPNAAKREPGLIVAVGRITRSKRFDDILRAFAKLPKHCSLTIAGLTITERDQQELKSLQALMHRLGIADRVSIGALSPDQMPDLFQRADMALHACVGGLDKVVLEAMACGCPVVSSSEAAAGVLPSQLRATTENMTTKAGDVLALAQEKRAVLSQDLRQRIESHHSIERCIAAMVEEMERH